ncbi:hypothetical protein DMENIID0001_131610 [Sergentomyia squamirostris]
MTIAQLIVVSSIQASMVIFMGFFGEIVARHERSVKKDSPTPETSGSKNNSTSSPVIVPTNSTTASPVAPWPADRDTANEGESLQTAFLAFAALGILLLFFIVFRSFRLRTSRAERRYGVQGDRNTQELTPLPMAAEEDEDSGDEQILFDASHNRLPDDRSRMVL